MLRHHPESNQRTRGKPMDYIQQQLDELNKRIDELKELTLDPEMADLAKAEIEELEKQKLELEQSASTPMSSPSESTNTQASDGINSDVAILEIRSAAGGDEAGLFAGDLLRM